MLSTENLIFALAKPNYVGMFVKVVENLQGNILTQKNSNFITNFQTPSEFF